MLTSHDLHDLRHLAAPVNQPCVAPLQLGARGVAAALSGVVRLVANQYGHGAMRRACASLALHRATWADWARTDPAARTLVAAAEGLLKVAGLNNVSAALAFWSCETDPAVWREVAAAA